MSPYLATFDKYKGQRPDCVLLLRIGDFYETFRSDAEALAKALGLTLTSRGGVPMAGIPYHQLDTYVRKAIAAGFRVAVCEPLPSRRRSPSRSR